MSAPIPPSASPESALRALVVDPQDWVAPSVTTVLSSLGFALATATSGSRGLGAAALLLPDLVILDASLPDMSAARLCAGLTDGGRRTDLPVVVVSTAPLDADERARALRNGAWDVLALPLMREELVLKVTRWVAAARTGRRAENGGAADEGSLPYRASQLLKRMAEISADAARHQRPLACVVLGSGQDWADPAVPHRPVGRGDAVPPLVLNRVGLAVRASDTVGVLPDGSLAVIAPGTDADGARVLAHRLVSSATTGMWSTVEAPLTTHRVRAGFSAVSPLDAASVDGLELLARAARAMRRSGQLPDQAAASAEAPGG